MNMKFWKIALLISVLILPGCQRAEESIPVTPTSIIKTEVPTQSGNPSTTQSGNPLTMEAYVFKTSEPGKITVKGYLLVVEPMVTLPDPNDAIFMVPIPGSDQGGASSIPSFTVGEVPQAEVDERTGDFVFTNLDPGQYAIVVLTTGRAQIPARFNKNGNLAIINLQETDRDHTIELENLRLP